MLDVQGWPCNSGAVDAQGLCCEARSLPSPAGSGRLGKSQPPQSAGPLNWGTNFTWWDRPQIAVHQG